MKERGRRLRTDRRERADHRRILMRGQREAHKRGLRASDVSVDSWTGTTDIPGRCVQTFDAVHVPTSYVLRSFQRGYWWRSGFRRR